MTELLLTELVLFGMLTVVVVEPPELAAKIPVPDVDLSVTLVAEVVEIAKLPNWSSIATVKESLPSCLEPP